MVKGEPEYAICEYLRNQGVIAAKRFTIKQEHETIETNTILLTFNSVTVPKSLRIFYRIIPVTIYVPNPLRCFNIVRGLDIMKEIALLIIFQSVRNVVLLALTIWQANALTQ